MQIYLNLWGLHVPSYGFLILLGALVANISAFFSVKKWQLDFNDLIILEGYLALGAIVGAKLLYLLVSYEQIDFSQIFDLHYIRVLMGSGFVFYGALIGALIAALLVERVHGIDVALYLSHLIFMVPLMHAFGRMGCFMAGCCYGIPYSGFLKVRFPVGSLAPSGVDLFPVQLVEAVCLLVLAAALFLLDFAFRKKGAVYLYLISYGVLRFVLEYYRYDSARGHFGDFSTSQWLSIAIVIAVVMLLFMQKSTFKDRGKL